MLKKISLNECIKAGEKFDPSVNYTEVYLNLLEHLNNQKQ